MNHRCPSCGCPTDRLSISGGRWWFCLWCDITGNITNETEGATVKPGFFEPGKIYHHISGDSQGNARTVAKFHCLGVGRDPVDGDLVAVGYRCLIRASGNVSRWTLSDMYQNNWDYSTWVVVGDCGDQFESVD